MMTCNREEIGAWIDGETRDPDMAAHLADCDECRQDEQLLRALRDDMAALPTPPLPDDFNARVMAAVQPALARRTRWRDRLDAVVHLFLGGERRLSLAEIGASALGVIALSGTIGFLNVEMYVARVEHIPWLNPATRAVFDTMPHGHADALSAWGSTMLAVLLVATGLLCGRLIGLPPRGASVTATARACAGHLGVYATLACVYLFTISAMNLDYNGWMRLLQGRPLQLLLFAACGASWWLVVRGRLSHIALLAGAFYACLLAAWGGLEATGAALWWGEHLDTALLTVGGLPALHAFLYGVMPGLGLALAGLALAASSRPLAPAVRGAALLLALVALTCVTLGSRPYLADVFEPTDRARVDAELGLQPTTAAARTIVITSSRGSVTVPCNTQWRLSTDNLDRCRAWIAVHPSGLNTLIARRLLALAAVQDWDDSRQWALTLDVLNTPGSGPWTFYQMQRVLSFAPPTATAVTHLRDFSEMVRAGLAGRDEAVQQVTRGDVAESFLRLGADADAAKWKPGWRPVHLGALPVTMRDGVVRGRLLLDGRPLAGVPVRLLTRRTGDTQVEEVATEAEILKRQPQELRYELVGAEFPSPNASNLFRPLVATRTDADGRFRFDGLPDDTWCLAVLVDGTRPNLRGLLPQPVRTSPEQRVVSLGDVRLEDRP